MGFSLIDDRIYPQVIGWLLSVPGASNTVLETVVPYSRMSMIQLLGKVVKLFRGFHLLSNCQLNFVVHWIYFCLKFCCRFRLGFVANKRQKKWLCCLIIAHSSSLGRVSNGPENMFAS